MPTLLFLLLTIPFPAGVPQAAEPSGAGQMEAGGALDNVALLSAASQPAFLALDTVPTQERPGPRWAELRARPFPAWFLDAKLGIFIHWGVYSVPAYSGKEDYAEWFLRGLQEGDTLRTRFLRENYGPDFRYRDFAPLFRAELFDPAEWAELFRRAGARYVVMVSKHHDGFALWPSRYSPFWKDVEPGPDPAGPEIVPRRTGADWVPGEADPDQGPRWNSADLGPKRDLVGDLTEAVRDAGLHMGLYYSLAEWNNPLHRWYTDPPDSIGPYVDTYMIPQFQELVSRYRPELIFSDGEWLNSAEQWHARQIIGWYFDTVGPEAVVNDRWGAGSEVGFRTPEYSAGLRLTDRPWAEVRGLGRSFGLNRGEKLDAYMSPWELVHAFARAVAAGGGMILNVGPGADGRIPLLQQERLIQLGSWLKVNGESIYGSRPWVKSGETEEVSLERVDPNIDFDWVRNGPGRPIREDEFTATWTGYLEAPASGRYTFEAEADDFVRVWVDGEVVVDSIPPGDTGAPGLTLHAGVRYPIRAEYLEKDVNASVRLFWRRKPEPRPRAARNAREPGPRGAMAPRAGEEWQERGDREVIPARALFTGPEPDAPSGLRARYTSLQETLAYTRKGSDLFVITFQWPDGTLTVPIPEPPPKCRIMLLGGEGELPWRYEDGRLIVDFSGVPYSEIPGDYAWTLRLEGYLTNDRGEGR